MIFVILSLQKGKPITLQKCDFLSNVYKKVSPLPQKLFDFLSSNLYKKVSLLPCKKCDFCHQIFTQKSTLQKCFVSPHLVFAKNKSITLQNVRFFVI